MQLGLVSTSFQGSLGCGLVDTPWLIERAAAAGMTTLSITPPVDADTVCDELRRRAEASGVALHLLAGSLDRETLCPILERALRLDARTIRMRLGWRYPYRQPGRQGANLDLARRKLEDILPTVESAGLTLAIENYGDATSKELAKLVRSLKHPNVRVCLDAANNIALLEDPVHTAKVLAPLAAIVHLRDVTFSVGAGIAARPCPLGEGDLDLPKIVETIVRHAPSSKVSFAIETPVASVRTGREVFQIEDAAFESSIDYCASALGICLPESLASRRRIVMRAA